MEQGISLYGLFSCPLLTRSEGGRTGSSSAVYKQVLGNYSALTISRQSSESHGTDSRLRDNELSSESVRREYKESERGMAGAGVRAVRNTADWG